MSERTLGLADQALLRRLGEIARTADGAPDHVYEAGRAALGLRRLDAELAELIADSNVELAGVRSTMTDARLLSFEAEGLGVEVQVSPFGAALVLLGQIVPPPGLTGGHARLEARDGTTISVQLDADGGFRFAGVTADLVRIHVELNGASAAVTTTWVWL